MVLLFLFPDKQPRADVYSLQEEENKGRGRREQRRIRNKENIILWSRENK